MEPRGHWNSNGWGSHIEMAEALMIQMAKARVMKCLSGKRVERGQPLSPKGEKSYVKNERFSALVNRQYF